jgi:methylamine dehydrogenase heavy chain
MIVQSRWPYRNESNGSHLLFVVPAMMMLLATGCTSAAAFAPAALQSPTDVVTPVPIRPSTATPLPLGERSIFVVDPHDGNLMSDVLVVDPDARRVVRMIPTRYAPEIAISPDGQRLYVADSYSTRVIRGDHHDVVSVYAISNGQLLRDDVDIPDRLIYKLFPDGHPFMFLSRDGRRLFVGKYGSPDIHASRMAVLDAETFKALAEYPRPDCDLLPLLSGELLCVGSGQQPRLVDALTGQTTDIPVSLPAVYTAAVLAPSADRLYLVSTEAQSPIHLTVADLSISSRVTVGNRALSLPPDHEIGFNHVAVSGDESQLYIGFVPKTGALAGKGVSDTIWAFDTKSGTRVGVLALTEPAWQVALSADGKQLYTVNPFSQSLSIFDSATFRELSVVRNLGNTPAEIVVPFTSR